jgi:hypothetical protein
LAHSFLQSGRHSLRDFCSVPLGLVHSYIPEVNEWQTPKEAQHKHSE